MPDTNITTILIVLSVLLFFALGIAIMVIIDHKARLPGGFTENPFSIIGMRRDHPVIAFLTTMILFAIMAALIFEMIAALAGSFGIKAREPGGLIAKLKSERTSERLRHFHHYPPQQYATQGEKNVCFICHGDYPHSKEPLVRALLNMHTQFIGCMTCHNDTTKVAEASLSFKWLNYSGLTPKGNPYGTEVDPKIGTLLATDDYYSKIVAYTREGAEDKLLEVTLQDPEAKEFSKIHTKLSDHDREAVKKQFHRLVARKGRLCSRCHTEEAKSYLPLRALGFSDRRVRDLTHLNIAGLVEKYKEFHTPSLTKGGRTAAPATPTAPAAGDDMRRDPRSWWKDTYDAPKPKPAPPKP